MLDLEDKKARAKLALEYYIRRENPVILRPDGEDDRRLTFIMDRLAELVVTLSVWFSESASWMRWSAECPPPPWAASFLTQEEIEGKGPPRPPRTEEPPPKSQPPKSRRKTKTKPRLTKAMTDPNSPEFIGMRPEHIQALIDHYHELPFIDPKTGKPLGLIE